MLKALQRSTVHKAVRLARKARQSSPAKGQPIDLLESFDHMSEVEFDVLVKGTKEKRTLKRFLKRLSEDELAELTAVFWLGRDRLADRQAYRAMLAHAKATMDEHAAKYLAGKISLAEELEAGLAKIGG